MDEVLTLICEAVTTPMFATRHARRDSVVDEEEELVMALSSTEI